MSRQTVPAGEGVAVEAIDRRKALTAIGAISAVAASGAAFSVSRAHAAEMPETASTSQAVAIPAEMPSAELVELHKRFEAARTERIAAIEARDWIKDEWRHVWPLAPEEILGMANADFGRKTDDAERDIAGDYLYRETAPLTEHLSVKFREENETTCFFVDTVKELTDQIKELMKRPATGRTPKSLARNEKIRAEYIAYLESKIEPARAYEAETKRIREASGIEAAKQRVKAAETAFDETAGAMMDADPANLADLRLMAAAIAEWNDTVWGKKLGRSNLGSSLRFPKLFLSVTAAA